MFQTYIDQPLKAQDITLFQDQHVLIIKDKFPKALRHYLIIPTASEYTKVHPLQVFQKFPKLHQLVSDYVEKTKQLIVDDLIEYQLIDSKDVETFKSQFIQVGVHSIPSLNNLHIHVMTKDFNSPRLKHKKHYNSFTTKFFVAFDQLKPLPSSNSAETVYSDETQYPSDEEKTPRLETDPKVLEQIIKTTPLRCSYCHASFGNSFVKLKQHLSLEFGRKYNQGKNNSPNP